MPTILAIDDKKENLIILKAIVTEAFPDSTLYTVTTGTEGIAIAIANDPDVILLDVLMPEVDGFEVCRRLKQIDRVRDIPVVFLTSVISDRGSRIKALEIGAEAFLLKPIDSTELIAQINAMINIKLANQKKREEKDRLNYLVAERTRELEQSRVAILEVLNDLKAENDSRLRVEAELREAERFAHATINALPLHICVLDENGVIQNVNNAWRRFATENSAAVHSVCEGANYLSVCESATGPEKDDAVAFAAGIRSVMAGEIDSFSLEYSCHSSHEYRWFQGVVTRFTGPGIVRVVVTHENISERKRADEELKEQKQFFEQMFSQSSVSTQILDKDGWCERINPKLSEIFGVKPEHIEGRVYNIFQDAEIRRGHVLPLLEKVFQRGKTAEWDVLFDLGNAAESQHIEVADKSSRWYHNWAYPIFDRKGDISHVIIQHIDISERKKVEKALHLQITAVQTAANAIVITDRDGIIISVNKAFTSFTGYTEEEVIGKKPNILKSGRQPVRFYQNLWATILAGNVWKGEIENKRKDGSLYTEEMTITPVRESGGEISHFISIKQDITERKKLQNEFFQAQKVQSIGTLAGGIAHDFNNILGIILGYTTMLEGHRNDSHKYDEYLSVITKNVERGAALVQQILTFARKKDVAFRPLNVPAFIHELTTMLNETFPKTITFREKFAPGVQEILGDRTQIHQALLNLCVNARDAMPKGGMITIAVDAISIAQFQNRFPSASEDNYLRIAVSDTGVGMDEVTKLRVFDPFFTTKELGKGTGLGLSVVYGIMQSHHGFVDVESEKGHGTTFSLYLPMMHQLEKSGENPDRSIEDIKGGTETILVVEDEEFLLTMVCMFLQSKGYRYLTAKDGLEAIEVFTQHRNSIDAVLTDFGLPKINGLDAFRKMKDIEPLIRVIVASGYFEPSIKDELVLMGAKGFINKPYRPDDVLQKIRLVLDAS